MPPHPQRWRVALFALVIFLAGGAALAAYLAAAGFAARPAPADVAIVFGNTVDSAGHPSPRLAARLDSARELYAAGLVHGVIVSGGTGKEGFDEAVAMQIYLLHAGVPADRLVVDSHGINTRATCRNAAPLMQTRGWRTADVVTQYFHIVRARVACREAGIDVVGGLAPRYHEMRDAYSLLREAVALPVYLVRYLRRR